VNFITKHIRYYAFGRQVKNHPAYIAGQLTNHKELAKRPKRTDVINFLLAYLKRDTTYMEIGVRNPDDNYAHIQSKVKYSVDPGLEFKSNPVDFKVTSDAFFEQLDKGEILSTDIRFDVIFIDGLHTAEQVNKDIENSMKYLKEDGFLVLHDCNPLTEWHAREDYAYTHSPASWCWNGTVWKAYLNWRSKDNIQSCCIDTDWGVGILSKVHPLGKSKKNDNVFYEYASLSANRKEQLNLISFDELVSILNG
jgi:hypothetical protein